MRNHCPAASLEARSRWKAPLPVALVALAICTPGASAGEAAGRLVMFRAAEGPRASVSEKGTAWLFREDEDISALAVPLNQAVTLPPGTWRWQGEAPGVVTTGWNQVPEPHGGGVTVAEAPAVASCELSWIPPPRGFSPDRAQVVALEAQTVYDVDLQQRKRWAVPAGRFYLAAYRQGRLVGLDNRPRRCGPGERIEINLPGPPGNTEHDLVVPLELPTPGLELRDLWLGVRPSVPRGELLSVAPAAAVWMKRRGLALFPQLPAGAELELHLKHPKLRSLSTEFSALGGSSMALPRVEPRLRATLAIPVDYRPARSHKVEKIVGYFCGLMALEGRSDFEDADACRALPVEHRLLPGTHEYSFPDLDTGAYLFNAVVDEEVVYGLSNWLTPFLAPEAADFGEIAVQPLRERHIYGHLLKGEEPVPGSVRVISVANRAPDLVALTDDDLTYHLFYFGKSAIFDYLHAELPGTRGVPKETVYGLFYGLRFVACESAGSCKAFPNGASLAGDGRFDFQLGGDSGVEVRVSDEQSGAPVPGAIVAPLARDDEQVFLFFNGKTAHRRPDRGGARTLTNSEGLAKVRLAAGMRQLAISKLPDYELPEPTLISVEVSENDWAQVEVVLSRSQERSNDPRFTFPGGQPVSRAFLSVFDARGKRRGDGCSTTTHLDGTARFRNGCLDGSTVALLHAGATITFYQGSDLAQGGRVTVEPAPRRPGRIRILGADGRPRAGESISLVYGPAVLAPTDFAIAHGTGQGQSLVGPSDVDGLIVLGGVDLSPSGAPTALLLGDKKARPLHLSSLEPGGTLDVELSE